MQTTLDKDFISGFLFRTCRVHPKPNKQQLGALSSYIKAIETKLITCDGLSEPFPILTGSVAEFYIEPFSPCTGDIDVMFYFNDIIAMPHGHEMVSKFGDFFGHSIQILSMSSRNCPPAYVFLITPEGQGYNVMTNWVSDDKGSGPAITTRTRDFDWLYFHADAHVNTDLVAAIFCPVWPPDAANWSRRRRRHAWPSCDEIKRIMDAGCDVVPVAHRLHKNNQYQWRLSFSRAEVVLLNSWTVEQQMVYHLLRFLVKTELDFSQYKDYLGHKIFSNYFIKTTMLWACEETSTSFWTDSNVLDICAELLNCIANNLESGTFGHYFVSECNLMYGVCGESHLDNVIDRLRQFTNIHELQIFFSQKYVYKRLNGDLNYYTARSASSILDISTANDILVRMTEITDMEVSCLGFRSAAPQIVCDILRHDFTCKSWHWLDSLILSIDERQGDLFKGFALLNVALKLKKYCASDLCDLIHNMISVQYTDRPIYSNYANLVNSFIQRDNNFVTEASDIINHSDEIEDRPTRCMIELELLKSYYADLEQQRDAHLAEMACLNVHSAMLHFTTGDFSDAARYSELAAAYSVLVSENGPTLKFRYVLHVDRDINAVRSILIMTGHIMDIGAPTSNHDLTLQLLAYFFRVKSLIHMKVSEDRNTKVCEAWNDYGRLMKSCLKSHDLLPVDVYLYYICQRKINMASNARCMQSLPFIPKNFGNKLRNLLIHSAVEHLNAFRNVESKYFDNVITCDYQAMYDFRSGRYKQCLVVSLEIVEFLLSTQLHLYACTFAELTLLTDEPVLLFYQLCPFFSRRYNIRCARPKSIYLLSVALYMVAICQMKLGLSETDVRNTLRFIVFCSRLIAIFESSDSEKCEDFSIILLVHLYRKTRRYLTLNRCIGKPAVDKILFPRTPTIFGFGTSGQLRHWMSVNSLGHIIGN